MTTYPPGYARRSNSFSATIERSAESVTEVRVEYVSTDADGNVETKGETLPFTEGDTLELIRATPASGRTFDLLFSWVQNAGQPSACRGNDRYRGIPIIAANQKAGDPSGARFEGRYRITKRRDPTKPLWTLKPLCDAFACGTTVRSTGGLRGKFSFTATGRYGEYVLEEKLNDGYCEVTYSDGRVVKWRAFAYRTIKLRPTKVRNGVAINLRGSERWDYEIPSDEYGQCENHSSTVARVVAERR